VNELSNTIDLESTLIRAETLFRKYQRLVEAVDKKENFPAPRKSEAEASNANGSSNSGTGDSRTVTPNKGKGKEDAAKVITPELRKLLSKQVDVLPRTTVAENGDGMPTR
jgi:hypothetical protein